MCRGIVVGSVHKIQGYNKHMATDFLLGRSRNNSAAPFYSRKIYLSF